MDLRKEKINARISYLLIKHSKYFILKINFILFLKSILFISKFLKY